MPLGVRQVARAALGRSRRGLFGGKRRLSGNKVSEDGDNKYVRPILSIYGSRFLIDILLSLTQDTAVLESKRSKNHSLQQHTGPEFATESDYIRAQVRHIHRLLIIGKKHIDEL